MEVEQSLPHKAPSHRPQARRTYYLKNRARILELQLASRKRRGAKIKAYNTEYRSKNKEKNLLAKKKWREANREWKKNWDKENLHRHRSYAAKRKSTLLKATPEWANKFFIDEAYQLASLRTKLTGIEWEVDHIVPLKSKIVCGLHVHDNLRVIEASKNHAKGNHYWPQMPEPVIGAVHHVS